jgi:hypothetical protein
LGKGASLDNQPKGALKKPMYTAKLNAALKILEEETKFMLNYLK